MDNKVLKQFIKDANSCKEVSKDMKDFINNDYVMLLKLLEIMRMGA